MSAAPLHTPDGDVYEVFARFGADEPLHHVGTVIAPDPELAGWYAQTLYDEWAWSEMIAVARRAMLRPLDAAPATPAEAAAPYHLYGRKTSVQPLTYLGCVDAPAGADFKAACLAQAGDLGWMELVAFPASAIVRVVSTSQAGRPQP